jgi:ABC-type lipoprotein release transport system permease subunit
MGSLDDPVVLATVSLVLCAATMLAAAIPAKRAASIHPADALRAD